MVAARPLGVGKDEERKCCYFSRLDEPIVHAFLFGSWEKAKFPRDLTTAKGGKSSSMVEKK
jgi:hypothetical protein